MLPAIIGAGVALGQLGTSLWNASKDREAQEEYKRQKREAIDKALGTANSTYTDMMNKLDNYNKNRYRLANDQDVTEYKNFLRTWEPETQDFGRFGDSYNKSVEDFINPEADKIAELAGLKTQAGLAGEGAAKGTGALANMGYSKWEAARDLYKDAQQAYQQDRSNAYQEYGDYIDRMQRKLDTINNATMNRMSMLGGAIQNEQQQQSDYMADLLGIIGDKAATNVNATIGAF